MALICLKVKIDLHLSYNSWCLVNLLRKKRDRLHSVLGLRQSPPMPCKSSRALLPTASETHSHSLDWSFLVGWNANSTIREKQDSAPIHVLLVTVAKLTPRSNTGRTRWHNLTNVETDMQTTQSEELTVFIKRLSISLETKEKEVQCTDSVKVRKGSMIK